jgi:two-component system, chemotaxis family, chemotaxis protein CheY
VKILIVDDYGTMRRIVRSLLATIGHTDISEAATGSEAMERTKQVTIDLVITDYNMEPMTGLELAHSMRSAPALKNIPLLLMLPSQTVIAAELLRQAGVSGCIHKPFTPTDLKAAIAAIVSRSS